MLRGLSIDAVSFNRLVANSCNFLFDQTIGIEVARFNRCPSNQQPILTMRPINTVLLSFGMSGKLFHAPFLHVHPDFHLYGVWERSKNLAASVYPDIKTFRSLDDVLQDPLVDLVIVNTPNATHFEYAEQVLRAGKHVVVEKPFVVKQEEGYALHHLAAEKSLVLSPFQNRRWDSDFLTVQQVVNSGVLEDIVEAEFHFDRFKQELSPKRHKEVAGAGTGALYDLGPHLIDQALVLFGWPQAVFADIRTLRPLSAIDDYFELLLYYDALRVRLRCSYIVKEPLPAYSLHGTGGSFIKTRADRQEADLQNGLLPNGEGWGIEPKEEQGCLHTAKDNLRRRIPTARGNYLEYYSRLSAAIQTGAHPPVTAGEGIRIIQLIEAAFQSHQERRVITL
jgi:scyllo-inositol 2-dehydrogenase (NADP+)